MDGIGTRVVAACGGVGLPLALLAYVLFEDWGSAAERLARLLGDDPLAPGGLRRTAALLLVLVVVLLAGTVVALAVAGPVMRLWARRSYGFEDLALALRRQPPDLRELTVVGYSLSFAEPLRMQLLAGARTGLTVVLGVPDDAYLRDHCKEDRAMSHRRNRLDGRLKDWQDLEKQHKVASVRVVRQHAAPHLFAVDFGKTIYFGRYPFVHEGGKHVLRRNEPKHRRLIRVGSHSPQVLVDTIRQQVDCQTTP